MPIKQSKFYVLAVALLTTTHLIAPISASAASCASNISGPDVDCEIDNNGQALTVDSSGVITAGAGADGVHVTVATNAGDITNYGTIDTLTNVGRSGIHVNGNATAGDISNMEGATINADLTGIYVQGNTRSILNNGSITGRENNGIHVNGANIANDIINDVAGYIYTDGTHLTDAVGILVRNGSTVDGDVINRGSIEGNAGIYVDEATVRHIVNEGAIDVNLKGISITHADAEVISINNHGQITSGEQGIYVHAATVGSISNRIDDVSHVANITGQDIGIAIESGAEVNSIFNNGTIIGNGRQGISVASATVAGAIENDGTITGEAQGIYVSDSNVDSIFLGENGQVTSNTSHAVDIANSTIANGIINNGSIEAGANSVGIKLHNSQISAGGISNVGENAVINSVVGIGLDTLSTVNGNITNSGQINAALRGISIDGSQLIGDIINEEGGTIEGGYEGIRVTGLAATAGNILNDTNAYIFSDYKGIAVENGATVASIVNNGRIASGQFGLYVANSEVTNSIVNNAGATIQGDLYSVMIITPNSGITFDNYGTLDGAIRIDGATLNLETGTIATGTIGGLGGIVNINTDLATASNYGIADGGLEEINVASGKIFTALTDNITFQTQDFNNDGTLSILNGNVVNIWGDYNQAVDGVLRLQASSTTEYGQLSIDGDSTFADGTGIYVDALKGSNFAGGVLEDVVTVSGTLNADATTFIVEDNSYLFNFSAINGSNYIDLLVSKDSINTVEEAVKQNNNNPAKGASVALDNLIALNPGGDADNVINAFGTFTNTAQVSDAVSQTLPVLTGGATKAIMHIMGTTNRIVQARQEENLGLSSGEGFVSNRNFWLKPFGTWSNQGNDNGIVGFDADTIGAIAGTDKAISDKWNLGFAVAYANTDMKSNDARHKLDVDTYQITTYGSYAIDPKTEVNLQANLGYNNNNSTRSINFGGLNRTAKGDFSSLSAHLGAGIGQVFSVADGTTITPSARVDYSVVSSDSYTESDAGALNLRVKSQTSDQFVPSLGAKLGQKISDNFAFSANAGVGYDVINDRNSVTSSYVGGGGAFITEGMKPAPWIVSTGAGLTYNANDNFDITVRYDREDRGEFDAQTASIKLRMPF